MTAPRTRTVSLGGPIGALAALLLVGAAIPSVGSDAPASRGTTERPQVAGRPLAMDELVAWCIVPFDSRKRTPVERIAMLERLGFRHYAYDWRTEHLPDTARELRLARDRGIRVEAVWMWIDAAGDRPGKLSNDNERLLAAVKEAGLSTQIWIGFAPGCFEGRSDEEKAARAVEMVRYLSERAAETKSRVALYNHGDWFGEPESQVRIIQALPGREIGIVYNFHHGHEHIARFDAVVKAIRPHLWCVNLNGMRPEGPKILPFGTGTHERKMLQALLDSGFTGPFGVLGHVDDADVEEILRGNLRGLGFTPR
jgi:sugar phosphate isomerase/epimerase